MINMCAIITLTQFGLNKINKKKKKKAMRKRKDALYKSKICSLFLKKQDNYKRPNIMFPIENKLIDLVQVILLFIKKNENSKK